MKKIILFSLFFLTAIALYGQKEDPFGDGWKEPNFADTIYHCNAYNELELYDMQQKGITLFDTCKIGWRYFQKYGFEVPTIGGASIISKTQFKIPKPLPMSFIFHDNVKQVLRLDISTDTLKAIYENADEAAEALIQHTIEKYNGRMASYKATIDSLRMVAEDWERWSDFRQNRNYDLMEKLDAQTNTIDSLQHIIAMFRNQGYKDMEDYLMEDTTTGDGILSLDNDTSFGVTLPDCDSIKQCYFDIIELQENQWLSIALKAEYQNLESWYDYQLTNCNAGKNVEYCNFYSANVFPRYESCLPCERMQEITLYPTVTSRFWKWVPLPSSFEGWMTWRMEKAIKNGK